MGIKTRLWWIDNSDADVAKEKLSFVKKGRFADFQWIRWDESDFANSKEAFERLYEHLCSPPAFVPGKAVVCYGIPSCQAEIATMLPEISKDVILIIVARPDVRISLYKAGVAMAGKAKMDQPLPARNKQEVLEWLRQKAAEMSLEADDNSLRNLIELVGVKHNSLIMELKKLSHLSLDGKIHPWVIQEGCSSTGESDVVELCNYIVKRDFGAVHEIVNRLFNKGEDPLYICGFLSQWCRKMAIAACCNGDFNSVRDDVSKLSKYQKPNKDPKDSKIGILYEQLSKALLNGDKKQAKNVQKLIEEENERIQGKSIPLFSKPGAVFYSCKEYKTLNAKRLWPYWTIERLKQLQFSIRTGKDPRRAFHEFFWTIEQEIIGER